jgi:hypothetical protein
METPIPIHPYDMDDLLTDLLTVDLLNLEHKEGPNGPNGPATVKVKDKWYIEDVNVPYKGHNPEFLEFLKTIKEMQ